LPTDHFSETIKRKFPQIFDWLELQSINERVILALMILVSIINMVTALLILILERTRMIGILTALGASRVSIREVFLIQAGIIVLTGLVFGNLLGLSLCYLQDYFGFIKLDEASYYLSVAPIKIDFYKILLINVSTVVITMV
ncbi:MAG TPA: ABC transporter permease, partial [Saprospirales bacterium]|nr:ABC transporter permease [Saprospirales bacterium]